MGRVIQDSDEDGNSGSCTPLSSYDRSRVASPALATTRAEENSLPLASIEADLGTSSTEFLKRNIQAAHRDLVASIPSTQASIHLDLVHNAITGPGIHTVHSSKRRNTVIGMESSQSPGKKIERRNTGKIYGQPKQKTHAFLFDDSDSAFEALAVEEDQISLVHCTHLSNTMPDAFLDVTLNVIPDATSTGVSIIPRNLPGPIHDRFEPSTVFPYPSSTVPDNTLTQQRLLDEALSNHLLEPIPGPVDPPHSSTPWSTFMTNPSEYTNSDIKLGDESGHSPMDSIKEPGDYPSCGEVEPFAAPNHPITSPLGHSPENTLSSAATAGCLKGMRHPKTSTELINPSKSQDTFIDELSLPASYLSSRRKNRATPPTTEGLPTLKKSKPKEKKNKGERNFSPDADELNPEDPVANTPLDTLELSRRRHIPPYDGGRFQVEIGMEAPKNSKSTASEPLVSDDAIIGLPEERYKPRPSRSRSARVIEEEPIDYSIRPEKAARLRAKRNKTSGESTGRVISSSSEKLERICIMGFSPSRATKALEEANGSFNEAIEWLCSQPANRTQGRVLRTVSKESSPQKSFGELLEKNITDTNNTADRNSVRPSSQEQKLPNNEAQMIIKSLQKSPKANSRGFLHVEIPAISNPSAKMIQDPRQMTTESELELNSEDLNGNLMKTTIPRNNRTGSNQLQNHPVQLIDKVESVVHQSKRRKTTQLEDINKTTSVVHQSPGPPKEKRGRGRGRPRLNPKPSEPTVDAHEDVGVAQNNFQPQQKNISADVLQENGASRIIDSPSSRDKAIFIVTDEAQTSINTPPESPKKRSSSTLKPTISATTGVQTSPKAKEASSPAHSPLSKGKVPFRVGLSKRARIAPLLRIVKK